MKVIFNKKIILDRRISAIQAYICLPYLPTPTLYASFHLSHCFQFFLSNLRITDKIKKIIINLVVMIIFEVALDKNLRGC